MSTQEEQTIQFNALTDRWLPLMCESGTVWASPVEVLCGEIDAPDLDYPRDDFRIYARLLLSALVQALFPAQTKQELAERIESPLKRSDVEARIAPVLGDFDLFGPTPFLQVTPPSKVSSDGAAAFVFGGEDLFRAPRPVDEITTPIALVMIFAEQTYAGGAGRGYGAGPGGQPGALTLLDPGSIRQGAWANTLCLDEVARKYAPDQERPWSNLKRAAQPRASIGLVTGLFFQPRSVWLMPACEGQCSFTGQSGVLVRRSPLLGKSELAKKVSGREDLWQHPCAPLAVNSQGIAAIRLNAERPAWTGLAQLLKPVTGGKKEHPSAGPAPVLQQWLTLPGRNRSKRPRLLILDFDRDKANVRKRFFEAFPLTDQFLESRETIDRLRALVGDAQEVYRALEKALLRAHDGRKQGLAAADAQSAFWTATEGPFLDWLAATTSEDEMTEKGETAIQRARQQMHDDVRRKALDIFDAHVSLSEFDLGKQERIAKARRQLRNALYPRPPKAGANLPNKEVNPQ